MCMLLMARRAHRARMVKGDRFTVWATAALVVAMAFVVAQEIQQLGKPFVWWRLPWLLLIVLLTLGALLRSDV